MHPPSALDVDSLAPVGAADRPHPVGIVEVRQPVAATEAHGQTEGAGVVVDLARTGHRGAAGEDAAVELQRGAAVGRGVGQRPAQVAAHRDGILVDPIRVVVRGGDLRFHRGHQRQGIAVVGGPRPRIRDVRVDDVVGAGGHPRRRERARHQVVGDGLVRTYVAAPEDHVITAERLEQVSVVESPVQAHRVRDRRGDIGRCREDERRVGRIDDRLRPRIGLRLSRPEDAREVAVEGRSETKAVDPGLRPFGHPGVRAGLWCPTAKVERVVLAFGRVVHGVAVRRVGDRLERLRVDHDAVVGGSRHGDVIAVRSRREVAQELGPIIGPVGVPGGEVGQVRLGQLAVLECALRGREAVRDRTGPEPGREGIVGGQGVAAGEAGATRGVGLARRHRLGEDVIERPGTLLVVGDRIRHEVHRTIDEQGLDPLRVGGGVRLHVLGAVALAVQHQLVGAEVVPERLEVLDRVLRRVVRQVRDVRLRLGHAVGDVRLGRRVHGVALGRIGRIRGAGVVDGGRRGALDRVRQTDPALVHEHEVVVLGDLRVVPVRVAVGCGQAAVAGPTGDRDERPEPGALGALDRVGDFPLRAARVGMIARDRQSDAFEPALRARFLLDERVLHLAACGRGRRWTGCA